MSRVVVECPGWLQRRAGEAGTSSMRVHLAFSPDDALAVRLDVVDPEGRRSRWVLSRDLLTQGLRSGTPVGQGEVQVQGTAVLVTITRRRGAGEESVLHLPWWDVRDFLRQASALVPSGQEEYDVDGWLTRMLAGTDRP